jgi:glycosyltransferase involved in cell wall biosynthesis
MYAGRVVAVVVPAFNEADKIAETVRGIPAFADRVIVVDDGSADGTERVARGVARAGLEVIAHEANRGVGAAIATGYTRALALGADVVAVMAGDGQMDPADLPRLLDPVVEGHAEYAKGNRFAWQAGGGWREMPYVRAAGGVALSWLTRAASGYWRLFDSQCGYTAISRHALTAIDARRMFARYGYPNDLLARLGAVRARVVDVPVRPVYGAAWRSGLKPARVALPLLGSLARGFARRMAARLTEAP